MFVFQQQVHTSRTQYIVHTYKQKPYAIKLSLHLGGARKVLTIIQFTDATFTCDTILLFLIVEKKAHTSFQKEKKSFDDAVHRYTRQLGTQVRDLQYTLRKKIVNANQLPVVCSAYNASTYISRLNVSFYFSSSCIFSIKRRSTCARSAYM